MIIKIVLGFALAVAVVFTIAFLKYKEKYTLNDRRRLIQNTGQYIQDIFLPYYNPVKYDTYQWGNEEICRFNGVYCRTMGETLNFLGYNQYELRNILDNVYYEEAREQFLYSVESFTKAETNKINTIMSKVGRYITQDRYENYFGFGYPTSPQDNNEPNIFIWQFQMYVYLEMLDFLKYLSENGGTMRLNRLDTSFTIYWNQIPTFRITDINITNYKPSNYSITFDTFTLSRLIWYIPSGGWSYEFMILLSLYNLVKTEPWINDNYIVHPEALRPNFFNNNELQRLLTKGLLVPIITPGSWVDFIFGSIRNGDTEQKFKLEWNSSFSQTFLANQTIVNAYGRNVKVPDYSFNFNENPSNKSTYKDYLFNQLIYTILEYENPITLPYTLNPIMSSVIKFVDQNLALRKQDFNRRNNLARTMFFNLNGCNTQIIQFTNDNGTRNGFTGYLTKMRENILDTIHDFPTLTLSGWFFSVIKPIILNLYANINMFPRLVVNNSISPVNLMEIKRLEGCYKPVTNPTDTPEFGGCRPVNNGCNPCRISRCNPNKCKNLRSHAAVDYYGRTNDLVKSTYFGIVIGIDSTFFTDICERNGRGSDSCPPGYSCNSSSNCQQPNGELFYLPAIVIKHIDGTIGRYAEFPSQVILNQELTAGQTIGNIVIYTLQCHFELYAGTENIIPWVEGGFGRNSQNAIYIMDYFVKKFTVKANTPNNMIFPILLNYKYVPNNPRCINACNNIICQYQRRRDLLNTDLSITWS